MQKIIDTVRDTGNGTGSLKFNQRISDALQRFVSEQEEEGRTSLHVVRDVHKLIIEFYEYDSIVRMRSVLDSIDTVDRLFPLCLDYTQKLAEIEHRRGTDNRATINKLNKIYDFVQEYVISAAMAVATDKGFGPITEFIRENGLEEMFDMRLLERIYFSGLRYAKMYDAFLKAGPLIKDWSTSKITITDRLDWALVDKLGRSFIDLTNEIGANIESIGNSVFGGRNSRAHDAMTTISEQIFLLQDIDSRIHQIDEELGRIVASTYIRQDVLGLETELITKRSEKDAAEAALKQLDSYFNSVLEPLNKPASKYAYRHPSKVEKLLKLIKSPTEIDDNAEFVEAKEEARGLVASLLNDDLGLKDRIVRRASDRLALLTTMSYDKVDEFKKCRSRLTTLALEISLLEEKIGPKKRIDTVVGKAEAERDELIRQAAEIVSMIYASFESDFGLKFTL